MAEISFASLSPTLLARKGGAKPAMRPQHAALASMQGAGPLKDPAPEVLSEALEDLGWNDMGEGEHASAEVLQLTPMSGPEAFEEDASPAQRPAIVEQQEHLAERIVAPVAPKRRPARERSSRAAFTLRLDADRHLKLRLATTIKGISAQALVTEALDALLRRMPELDTLAAQVKRH
ncbi:hypothetical protein GCM10011515_18920 [Tsuneonella deserti]|uniref:HicB family protein n=1 Tax=Tsuneonella deserti TaxID=2035528 RepID=A0ABQ1SAR8_9SPHN|nr:hypothetical protein [Tsuneonella deserti]GGD99347.1 hypothetical protein GCM10011515_18920 [Tsuneonella deserti]